MYRFDIDYLDEERGMKHTPCDDGEYVLAGVALTLQAKVEELTRSAEYDKLYMDDMEAETDKLQAKIEGLTAALMVSKMYFKSITATNWSYDGDFGANNTAELGIDAIEAALKQEGE